MNNGNEFLQALFTRVAGRYDLLNRALTFGIDVAWRRRAVKRLTLRQSSGTGDRKPDAARHVLDLATGTADLAIALARRFPSAHVTGLDLTPAMLEIGRRKVDASGCAERIELIEGNAQALPFADASFDAVTCAFGFRNFPCKQKALEEAARVLRPGGELLVLELFRMKSSALAHLTSCWLRMAAPLMACATKADYAYLRASIESTLSAAEFTSLAEKCGLTAESASFFLPSCHCIKFRNGVCN